MPTSDNEWPWELRLNNSQVTTLFDSLRFDETFSRQWFSTSALTEIINIQYQLAENHIVLEADQFNETIYRNKILNPWSKGFFHVTRSAAQSFVDSVDAPVSTFALIMYCILSRNKAIPKKSFQLVWQRWKRLRNNSKLTVARWTLISDSSKQKLRIHVLAQRN